MTIQLKMDLPIGSFDVEGYEVLKYWYSSSEKQTKSWVTNNIKSNWNIIDAGANIGMYSILFSKLAPEGTVYCFEPTDTMSLLKKNLENAKINNVQFIQNPLCDKKITKEDSIHKIYGQPNGIINSTFEFTSIDEFCQENNLKIDLIKIDVDSYDYEVLLGANNTLLSQSPYVIVELNDALKLRGYSKENALKYMQEISYDLIACFDNENYLFKKK